MPAAAQPSWWRLELDPPAELEESLLWCLDSLGVHRAAVRFRPELPHQRVLQAWLPEIDWPEQERQALTEALAQMGEPFGLSLPPVRWQLQPEEDWALSWKRHWQPDPVGERLLILPAWLKAPDEYSDRLAVLIDPGSAFGTGSHPTTRLCLEALEKRSLGGLRVVDLGCGSGILGIASLVLGAAQVLASDTDGLAVRATAENAALNRAGSALQVQLGSADVLRQMLAGAPADLLFCNILAPVLTDMTPAFSQLLTSSGEGLLSGLLIDQAPALTAHLHAHGWKVTAEAEQGRWSLLAIQRD